MYHVSQMYTKPLLSILINSSKSSATSRDTSTPSASGTVSSLANRSKFHDKLDEHWSTMGPPNLHVDVEVFIMVNNVVFRWPKPLFSLMVLGAHVYGVLAVRLILCFWITDPWCKMKQSNQNLPILLLTASPTKHAKRCCWKPSMRRIFPKPRNVKLHSHPGRMTTYTSHNHISIYIYKWIVQWYLIVNSIVVFLRYHIIT